MDHNSRSATVPGHVKSINTLFKLCKFDTPADLTNRANICSKIILAREKEESVAWQQSPITCKIYSALLDQARKSAVDSPEMVIAYWFKLIRITGLCCAEYAQKIQTLYDEHEYPSGKRVIKAFSPNNWKFYNSKGKLVTGSIEIPKKLKMTFWIQKNRQSSKSISLVADDNHKDICPVWATHCIYLRAKQLGQSDTEPMGMFVNELGIKR